MSESLFGVVARVLVAAAISVATFALTAGATRFLRQLFPLRDPSSGVREREQLEAAYRKELDKIAVWEFVVSTLFLIAFPVSFHYASTALCRLLAAPGSIVLFHGAMIMAIPHMIAGASFGVALVPALIDAHFMHPHAANLRQLYRHSEDRHGLVGRYLMTQPVIVSAIFLLAPIAIFGNDYTIVNGESVQYPAGLVGSGRVNAPHTEVERLTQVRWLDDRGMQKGSRSYIVYRNGRVLSSNSGVFSAGELASWGRHDSEEALRLIGQIRALQVEQITLRVGEEPVLATPRN